MILNLNIILIIAGILLASSIGFKKYVWFISIGYGLSISTTGLILIILHIKTIDILTFLTCITLIIYGFRLSGYLAYREIKSNSYNNNMKGEISDGKNMKFSVKIILWISCALLYLMMTSPIIYRVENGASVNLPELIGLIVMLIGITIETVSDLQKNASKKINSKTFVNTGLYQIVRCPNYLGELIMWTGVLITSINSLNSIGQIIISIIGYIGIVYVMFSGARRLEIRQDKNYGKDKKYQKYKNTTPILIPFIPLYSVKKHKWLVA